MIQNAFTGEPKAKPTPKPKPTPTPKTEAQQQSDFTAEGAPPAGNAAQTLPILPADGATRPPPAARPPDTGR